MTTRWSGFDRQSRPWQTGYEWAYDRGEYSHLDSFEALEAAGYDFDSFEAVEWQKGVDYAQKEQVSAV